MANGKAFNTFVNLIVNDFPFGEESDLCLQLSKCFVSHLKMGFGLRLTDGVYGDKRTPIGNRFEVCLVASSLVSSMAGDIVLA